MTQPTTGVAGLDTVVARLESLDRTPVEGHAEIYEEVHRLLQDALASLDEA